MEFNKKTLTKIFIGVGACIFLYWVLHEFDQVKSVWNTISRVFAPFVLGAGLAFVINVPMRSIENQLSGIKNGKLRRTLALFLTIVAVFLVLSLVFYLLIPQVTATASNFVKQLPAFFTNVQNSILGVLEDHPQMLNWFNENIDLTKFDFTSIIEKAVNLASNYFSLIVSGAITAIGDIALILVNAVIGIVFAIYCLFNKEALAGQGRKLLYAFFPEKHSDNVIRVLRLTNSTFSNFLSGQCIEVCILGALFAVSMAIFRMPYIPLVTLLVAVTAFIPVVGAFAGCILGAFFILVDNPLQAVGFVIMFLVIQQFEGNVIYPRVVGTSIGLPGMWVLLAVAVGGELMGVAGMFLMIPLASVLYVLLRETVLSRLSNRTVSEDKLQPQPPEIRSHLKIKTEKFKLKLRNLFKKK